MTEIPLYQVDAFADGLFTGNPAAVCPLAGDWLPDEVMQAIGAENNLAETAFLRPLRDGYEIRWFTPKVEVDLCGHATLASAYVVQKHLDPGCEEVRFQSASGPLTVACDGADGFTLDFPARPGTPLDDGEIVDAVAAAIGVAPQEVLKAPQMLAVLASEAEVRAVVPELARIAALPARGLIVSAPGAGDHDFVSRYFAPKGGIPEDPVTGSAHCTLAPYWSARLGKRRLRAYQASARGGTLMLEDGGARVSIGGRAVPYLEGRILVP